MLVSVAACTPRTAVHCSTRLTTLQGLGHDVIEVSLPLPREMFIDSYAALIGADVAATMRYASTLIGRRATRADVELATWVLA